jgi:hypothetical protein
MIQYFLSGRKLIKRIAKIKRITQEARRANPWDWELSYITRCIQEIEKDRQEIEKQKKQFEEANQHLIQREVAVLALEKMK